MTGLVTSARVVEPGVASCRYCGRIFSLLDPNAKFYCEPDSDQSPPAGWVCPHRMEPEEVR